LRNGNERAALILRQGRMARMLHPLRPLVPMESPPIADIS